MAKRTPVLFPGYRISPDGTDYRLFERAEDVPEGYLRETPESFAKKGLGNKPLRPVSDEHKHEPADYEAAPKRGPGRPRKEVPDGSLDL